MEDAVRFHQTEYGSQPVLVVSAPVRIHLLGEHSWYFKDKTLSLAVNRCVYIAISFRDDSALKFYFVQLNERKRALLSTIRFRKEDRWANVLKGVIDAFMQLGYECKGMDITVYSEILPSSGLGITSALKAAMVKALFKLYGQKEDKETFVNIIDAANRDFLGVTSYLSDIYTVLFAKKDHCLITDCNDGTFSYVPFSFPEKQLLLTDVKVPRATVWNEPSLWTPEFACLLGDLKITRNGIIMYEESDEEINEILAEVNEDYRRRLICIIKEQAQLNDAVEALKQSNFSVFARAVVRSHEYLRDLFSISCPEVDWLVKRVTEFDTFNGRHLSACSRITGKGFATYTFLNEKDQEKYFEKLTEYEHIFGFHPVCYKAESADGICKEN